MTTRTEEAEWMTGRFRLIDGSRDQDKGTRGRVQIHVFFFFFLLFVPCSFFFLLCLASLRWLEKIDIR